jgi:hypothetical protein
MAIGASGYVWGRGVELTYKTIRGIGEFVGVRTGTPNRLPSGATSEVLSVICEHMYISRPTANAALAITSIICGAIIKARFRQVQV